MSHLPFRIGHGYDVHAFEKGDHLMLGGVRVLHDKGFMAHSDGDAVIHALCDALLGAVAQGDIGQLFSDRDPQYKNMDSRLFLREVTRRVTDAGYQVGNVDLTIVAQAPRMAPHVEAMRGVLSAEMEVEVDQVSVKATTTERLGFEGQEQGVAAHVVVLLVARA